MHIYHNSVSTVPGGAMSKWKKCMFGLKWKKCKISGQMKKCKIFNFWKKSASEDKKSSTFFGEVGRHKNSKFWR